MKLLQLFRRSVKVFFSLGRSVAKSLIYQIFSHSGLSTAKTGDSLQESSVFSQHKRFGQTEVSTSGHRDGLQHKNAILFFSPEGGITPHFAALCVLGRILKEMGHPVIFVICRGSFDRCPVIDMKRLSYDTSVDVKDKVCQTCTCSAVRMLDAYELDSIDLSAFITSDILHKQQQALETLPTDLREFQFDSIEFGKLCTTELALIAKKHRFDEPDKNTYKGWTSYIRSSLMSYLLVDRVCELLPVSRLVYYDDYSLMIGARLAANKHGLASFRVLHTSHLTVDRRRYTIMPTVAQGGLVKQRQVWSAWRELSLTKELVEDIADDLIVRLSAKSVFVYSPSKTFGEVDLYEQLHLSPHKKLVVAYTSSIDEVIALQMSAEALGINLNSSPQPFKDQIDWLNSIIEYAEENRVFQLVIRVHPRIGPNKREGKASEFLVQLQEQFNCSLENVKFVWPEDQISSYDLGEIADLVLVAWSSIGLEFARLGVPVLVFDNDVEYFPSFMHRADTAEQYFEKLIEILNADFYSSEGIITQIRQAFSWYSLRFLGASINLEDVIPDKSFAGLPNFAFPSEASTIVRSIVGGESTIDINLERLQHLQQSEIVWEERLALQHQLRRIIHFLLTGEDIAKDYRLHLITCQSPSTFRQTVMNHYDSSPKSRFISIINNQCYYWYQGKFYSKYSPMCIRLAIVCAYYPSCVISSRRE